MRNSISLPVALVMTLFALQSTAQNATTANLLETLNADSRFTTFYSYLNQVGLLSTLRDYPYNLTVVAPTNAAFTALQQSYLGNDLFEGPAYIPRDIDRFRAYMQYHFVQGSGPDGANATDIGTFYQTLLANSSDYELVGGGQWVRYMKGAGDDDVSSWYSADNLRSNVTNSTLPYDRGTISPVSAVLLPPFTISETALDLGLHSFVGALTATSLTNPLNTLDPLSSYNRDGITVLAPLDSAFASIGSVLSTLNATALSDVLKFHVIPDRIVVTPPVTSDISAAGGSAIFSNGSTFPSILVDDVDHQIYVSVDASTGYTFLNNARVVSANIPIKNGLMHVIDQVLNPNDVAAVNSTATNGTVAYTSATSVTSTPYTTYPVDPPATTVALVPAATGGAAAPVGLVGKGGFAGSIAFVGGVAAAILMG